MERVIVSKVEDLVRPILEDEGIELVDVEFIPKGKRWILRVYIDKEGGVNLGDCEKVSRELGTLLDVEDLIDHPYILEVSSPGLTRQLKSVEDFRRYRGRLCRIVTKKSINGRNNFLGEIVNVKEKEIEVKEKGGQVIVPFDFIKKANLEFEI